MERVPVIIKTSYLAPISKTLIMDMLRTRLPAANVIKVKETRMGLRISRGLPPPILSATSTGVDEAINNNDYLI